jgi:hypothetical protein
MEAEAPAGSRSGRGTRRSPAVQVIAEATSGGDRLAFAPVALLAAVLFTI